MVARLHGESKPRCPSRRSIEIRREEEHLLASGARVDDGVLEPVRRSRQVAVLYEQRVEVAARDDVVEPVEIGDRRRRHAKRGRVGGGGGKISVAHRDHAAHLLIEDELNRVAVVLGQVGDAVGIVVVERHRVADQRVPEHLLARGEEDGGVACDCAGAETTKDTTPCWRTGGEVTNIAKIGRAGANARHRRDDAVGRVGVVEEVNAIRRRRSDRLSRRKRCGAGQTHRRLEALRHGEQRAR